MAMSLSLSILTAIFVCVLIVFICGLGEVLYYWMLKTCCPDFGEDEDEDDEDEDINNNHQQQEPMMVAVV
jgi:hypothetical protein